MEWGWGSECDGNCSVVIVEDVSSGPARGRSNSSKTSTVGNSEGLYKLMLEGPPCFGWGDASVEEGFEFPTTSGCLARKPID